MGLIALGRIVDVRLEGGRVFHPAMHWVFTNTSHSTYDSLHWARPATGAAEMTCADGQRGRLGPPIESLSYIARKGLQNAVYEHQFEEHELEDGSLWRPRIIWFGRARGGSLARSPELDATGSNGAGVFIGSTVGKPAFAISSKMVGDELFPFMTDHGIEG